ncbi:MAG TPA: hypothetical protein VNX88_24600 [Terriglobales bacterium]|nr:hypothetical protein [Terriglobales bacterium]
MKLCFLLVTIAISVLASAQTSYPPGNPPTSSQPASQPPAATAANAIVPSNPGDLATMLQRIEQETAGLNADVGKLRVEKWKIDSTTKRQASENIGSIQRNITGALPGLITAVRAAPQSLAANFKLYRNLNALYDVVASVSESTGAFGRREEYDLMSPHAAALDADRRNYGEYLQQVTTTADDRLAAAERAQAAAIAAQQQAPPKKIVVDDNEPTPPAKKKKTAKKNTVTGSAAASSASGTSTPK